MSKVGLAACGLITLSMASGCALKEIRSKTKFGPEFRHKGSSRTDEVRWTVQQGYEFKWEEDISTGITYRRRDDDKGNGGNDNGVWLDFSFPIWKASTEPDKTGRRILELERRLAQLEADRAGNPAERLADSAGGARPRDPD